MIMKNTIITELVKMKVLETVTDEQLLSKADILNDFQKMQDGFIDSELVKDVNENSWCFIYHFENMEKVKAIGEKMRNSKVLDEINPLIVPGTFSVNFYHHLKKW
jgi:hypothetical protein